MGLIDPTPQEVMKTLQAGGRIVPAVDEILDILRRVLPGTIDYINENRRGKNQELLALPIPTGYYVLGEVVEGDFPAIIVGAEVDTNTVSPRQFSDVSNVMVMVAYDSYTTKQQYYDSYDLAHVVRGVLMYFTRTHIKDDVRLWSQLIPTGITSVSGRWTDYKGHAAHFQMTQAPNNNLWTG